MSIAQHPDYLRVEDFAERVGAHPDTIRKMVGDGKLRAKLYRGSYIINRREISTFGALGEGV